MPIWTLLGLKCSCFYLIVFLHLNPTFTFPNMAAWRSYPCVSWCSHVSLIFPTGASCPFLLWLSILVLSLLIYKLKYGISTTASSYPNLPGAPVSGSFLCRFPFSQPVVSLSPVDLGPAVLPEVSLPKFFSQTGLRGKILPSRVSLEEKCSRCHVVKKAPDENTHFSG